MTTVPPALLAPRRYGALVAATLVGLGVACTGSLPPDRDGAYTKAAHLFSGVSVGDTIDGDRGDKEDWRKFRFVEDSEVTLLTVMAPLADNPVTGRVEVYDDTFSKVHAAPIRPGQNRYELRFTARGGKDYYVVVKADEGATPYQVRLDGQPVDPCRKCRPDERCENGRCVAPPPPPPPNPCGGCPPDLACDPATLECVTPACVGVDCPPDKRCDSAGRCVPISRRRPRRPRCGAGEVYKGGRCVPAAPAEPVADETYKIVRARVVQVVDLGGGKSEVHLDKGSAQGLDKNLPAGHLAGIGAPVRLVRIFPVRARAKVAVDAKKLQGRRLTVVFKVLRKKK